MALFLFLIRNAKDTVKKRAKEEPAGRVDSLFEVSFLAFCFR